MTYFKLRILIIIILMAVSSYYLFKFFTRISGVSIPSAVAAAFRFDSSVPVLLRVSALMGFFMFLCIIMVFFLYIETPKKILELDKYRTGGFMGYHTGDLHTVLYDPGERAYKDYYYWGGPSVPEKFTETFETVLIFKPPSREYYEGTSELGFGGNLTLLFILLFCIPALYIFLFIMAEFYVKYEGLPVKPDHRVIAENFREITGMPFWKAAIILFSVLLVLSAITAIWATVLNRNYMKPFIPEQQALRSTIMEKVTPGSTLRGKVILRFKESVDQSYTEETARGTRTQKSYYTMMNYTVEFRDILRVPVYLYLRLYWDTDESRLLEKPFTEKNSAEPEYAKEYSFIVNPDYSVSLKMEK